MTMRLVAALTAGLLLAACDLVPPADGGDLDGEWTLVDGTHDGEPLPIIDDAPITLTVEGTGVRGRAACNIYSGAATIDADRIGFGSMAVTEMGCDPAITDAEAAYLAALADVEHWSREGEALTLSGAAVELRYELIPPTPDADLVGTTWRLDSLARGDAVSSTMGEPATVEFADDGTMAGTTGCRTFQGRYELDGDAVRVSELINDDRACPGLEEQDEHVLAVLGDGFTYAVSGERLTLSAGQLGLVYVADEG